MTISNTLVVDTAEKTIIKSTGTRNEIDQTIIDPMVEPKKLTKPEPKKNKFSFLSWFLK